MFWRETHSEFVQSEGGFYRGRWQLSGVSGPGPLQDYMSLMCLIWVTKVNTHPRETGPVASLRLVSPGATTDGVSLFFPPKVRTFFTHFLSTLVTFFSHHNHSHSFRLSSDRFCSIFFYKFSRQKILDFITVSGRWWCHPGRSVPSPSSTITPLFD